MTHSIDSDQELLEAVKLLSPGTPLRDGVNLVLQGGLGSLIVLSDAPEVLALAKGGFHLDCEYTPMRLFELSKMDGAIILSEDLKRIVRANTNLVPDYEYTSGETGIRHQTGERFSKQTKKIVLTVSERRKTLHLYIQDQKYMFRSVPILISSANQTMLALERHIKSLHLAIQKLHLLEIRDTVTLLDVITAIQYSEMARRTQMELNRHRIELGNEVVSLHLNSPEQEKVIEKGFLVIRDYYKSDKRSEEEVLTRLQKLDDQALLNEGNISLVMGFPRDINSYIEHITPRGYRILSMIPRLSTYIIKNLIEDLGSFTNIKEASIDSLKDIKGIGEVRAQLINKEIMRIIYMAEKWST